MPGSPFWDVYRVTISPIPYLLKNRQVVFRSVWLQLSRNPFRLSYWPLQMSSRQFPDVMLGKRWAVPGGCSSFALPISSPDRSQSHSLLPC